MNKIMATLTASLMYFGLIKYMEGQEVNFITGMIIVLSTLIFAGFLIAMLLLAHQEDTEKAQEKR